MYSIDNRTITKQQKKENKKYQKNVHKKNKQLIKNHKKYPECKGDVNCIKIKEIIDEESNSDKTKQQDNKIHLSDKIKLKNVKQHQQQISKQNLKPSIKQERNKITSNQTKKNIDKPNKNKTATNKIKITKQQKRNIKKIEHMEFLNDKKILELMDEQQKFTITKKKIQVKTKNKGVPNMCIPGYSAISTSNSIKTSTKKTNYELENAKNNLKEHIKESLIKNEISNELIEYIMNNIKYITKTSKKNNEIVQRKVIDFINRYNVRERAIQGSIFKQKYLQTLQDIEDLFFVDKNIVLAIWSMETNYGSFIGNTNAFDALYSACLNADSMSRLRYFENNIISLAVLVEQGYFSRDVLSSFDGGLGGCQFMPDSFYKFAVSLDGTKTDIINKDEDVLASIGNYLHSMGWRYNEGVLTEIEIPTNIDPCLIGMNTVKTVEEWKKLGIKPHKNKIGEQYIYNDFATASVIITDEDEPDLKNKRAFLVYDNYKVILGYNQQIGYGLTAGLLFEAIK